MNSTNMDKINNELEKNDMNETNISLNISNVSLDDYVYWPVTPERKGTRRSDQFPFVLTSSGRKKCI